MTKKDYRFDPETLSYEEVKDPFRLRFYRLIRKIIVLFIIVCILNLLFSTIYYTPKMRRLAREENELLLKYYILNDRINTTTKKVDELRERDHDVYRRMFGADTLDIAGVYNPYPDNLYSYMADDYYGTLMTHTWRSVDALGRRIYLQSRSLDDLQVLAHSKEDIASSVPAIWPIEYRNVRKMDHYGGRMHPIYRRWIFHQGIDLGAHIGDAVFATANGVVKSTNIGLRRTGYGQQILIDHGFGYQTRYAHLSSIDVVPGQVIKRGEMIGKVGNTGGSTGPHLHYEVIYMGNTVNPINYLKRDIDEEEFDKLIHEANRATFESDFQ